MNSFQIHDKVEQDILKHTPRQLARRIIELEEQLKEAKADAIMECLAYAMERSAVQNTVYIKDVVTWVDKLRGNK